MNLLNEVLATQSDEKIKEIYIEFKSAENNSSAATLRTAFIRKKVLEAPEFIFSEILEYFIKEETNDIRECCETFSREQIRNFEEKENKEQPEFTRLNTFILAKLWKLGLFNSFIEDYHQYTGKENEITSFSFFESIIKRRALLMYMNLEGSNIYDQILAYAHGNISMLSGYKEAVLNGEPVSDFEKEVDDRFEDAISSEHCTAGFYHQLRQALLVLFIVNWCEGNMLEARLYLTKAVLLVDTKSNLYPILLFLQKELENLNEECV